MNRFWALGLVSVLSANGFADRVHVQASGGGGNGSQSVQGGVSIGGGDGGGTRSFETVHIQHTTLRPARISHRTYTNRAWARGYRAGTGQPGTYNPHAYSFNNRVSVVRSVGWNGHYAGRPYRYINYRGRPWYGFYVGPRYYWANWYGNRWWWYDTSFARWSFWYDGYWWCNAGAITYVYVDGNYVPYQPGVVTVVPPAQVQSGPPVDEGAPPDTEAAAEAPAQQDVTATSPDGRRMVQVVGPNAEAFLYDTSSGRSVFMRYLAKDVLRVRFDGGNANKPMGILVDYKTNSDFTLFDADGNPQGGSIVPSANTSPSAQPATTHTAPAPPAPLPS